MNSILSRSAAFHFIAIIANKTGFRGSKRGADGHFGLASTE